MADVSSAPDLVAFADPLAADLDARAVLGGKGAGLVEMTQTLGLPVPPGFIITTAVSRRYLQSGWPDGLTASITEHLDRLGDQLGRRFGDAAAPLLLSVRSGAPVSMPGMMDTLLNVGLSPAVRERLAQESGDPRFAADTWLRFSRMYAETVLEIDIATIDEVAQSDGSAEGQSAAAQRLTDFAAGQGSPIPDQPLDQLIGAVEAVFRSWNSDRAKVFRQRENIPDDLGTAVTIQAMVFGNLGDRSGTGVVFTRDPAGGDAQPFGDYLARAQGEDVVAGRHDVHGLDALQEQLPDVHTQLLQVLDRLERHYRDMCDVEFTVSDGVLHILQTRVGRRSPLAALRIAVAMAQDPDFPLTQAEAVARIDQDCLRELGAMGRVDPAATPLAQGLAASPGVGVGVLCCDADRAAELGTAGTAFVLARPETSPADVHGMVEACGLVTTRGGVASHAAVVARSWAIPAVTSLSGAVVEAGGLRIGDRFIALGELVTVDGGAGTIYEGDRREEGSPDLWELRTLREWAAELGVEPGQTAQDSESATQASRAAVTLLELVRTVQLKGLCTPERAAEAMTSELAPLEVLFAQNVALFKETKRGVLLSPEGREWMTEQIDAERAGIDADAIKDAYTRFDALNSHFKELVSDWQRTSAEGHSDDQWSELVASVESLHAGFEPILQDVVALCPRLAPYRARFTDALVALRGGDASMLASPLKDSYHTVWFELHEELIDLCGLKRSQIEE
ncbi:MAG: pyruvate, phosphate dikinase [Chloroflexi bacterium]|nr:pyruvate, phosphate dikinase [Chloroflexota bacterium]